MRPLALATVATLAASLASPALAVHQSGARIDARTMLRIYVQAERQHTWDWQTKAGAPKSPTRHLELHASVPYLRTLAKMWRHRHHEAQAYYKRVVRSQGYGATGTGPFPLDSCTRELLGREGGMNPHLWNGGYVGRWDGGTHGGSGAYGGPQALPGSKMASAGADWADNIWTQIKWMLDYVRQYGGSCGALSHSYSHGWY